MLYQYRQRVQQLCGDIKTEVLNPLFLDAYINTARGQIAGEQSCIRVRGTLSLTSAVQQYAFSSINLGSASGVQGVLNARMVTLSLAGTAGSLVQNYSWEWFNQFFIANPAPLTGNPNAWTQYGQGTNGTLLFYPVPTGAVTANIDTVCYPIPLVDDSTAEALPYEWTDAVPFFAAWLAYLQAQRSDEAKMMFSRYAEFAQRARAASTSSVLPFQFAGTQPVSPVMPGGVAPQGGAQ